MAWLTDQFARHTKSEFGFTDTSPLVKAILALWFVMLVPWLPFAGLSAMAIESGQGLAVYLFMWSIWLYPASLCVAFFFRQKRPTLVLLPLVNIAVWLTSGVRGP